MADIQTAFNNRVRYSLYNKDIGTLSIVEPLGWDSDEKEYSRNETYHGIVSKFSNSLKFNSEAADAINYIKDVFGPNSEIKLTREERHPITDEWTLSYFGYLDLSTWEKSNGQVSLKFNSGGMEQLIKSRESEKIEIDRLTSIDGKELSPLQTIEVEQDGRRIFLDTSFEVKANQNNTVLSNTTVGNTRGSTVSVPMTLVNKSHDESQSPIPNTLIDDNSALRTGNGEIGNMFFLISEKRRILKIKFKLTFTPIITAFDNVNFFNFYVRLATYQLGATLIHKNNRFLFTANDFVFLHRNTFTIDFDETVIIESGESLALEFDQLYDGANGHSSHLDINIWNIECDMSVQEDSFFDKTITKAVLSHELGERLVAVITGQEGAFYSEYLGRTDIGYQNDGFAGLIACTHGMWIRGFDKLPIPSEIPFVENNFKPLATSFKDFNVSFDAVFMMGLGIETIGQRERVRMEDLSYFYNRNVTIRLPNQAKNVKRIFSQNNCFSGIEIGYELGGQYEEAFGLDEYNAKSTFTTIISRIKNSYIRLSKYRADSYGIEFARRKQKSRFSTLDTPYDLNVFMLDLKRGITNFLMRKWHDDFEKEPTGVYSPETATNLRLTPFNNMLRHGWRISSGLIWYLNDYIRYGSSTQNSRLKTQFIGKPEYAENGDIQNSELLRARYLCDEIEFEHVCDFDIMQQVEGKSTFFGREIPNFYGLVEFTNEDNEIETGFLMNLKPNGKGTWKLLKANK
jgi:hypothetical protein